VITGVHHLGLTVRDVDASATWYGRVLRFEVAGRFEAPDGARRKVFLRHDGFGIRLGLTQHRGSAPNVFDETHVGLDHLAFGVGSLDELEAWARRLAGEGVTTSPIAPANTILGGFVLVFRDPDNIQLELVAETSTTRPADWRLAAGGAQPTQEDLPQLVLGQSEVVGG
jgi:catechol 2,3-dioxygenase-like lactoylglutathione lyase family enzyme